MLLFPLYALADLSLRTGLRAMRGVSIPKRTVVPIVNYVRLPVLGSGLTFLMFFPGIIKQGAFFYHNATGMTQDPFLHRWLLLVAAMFGTSAMAYALRLALHARRTPAAHAHNEPPASTNNPDRPHRNRSRVGIRSSSIGCPPLSSPIRDERSTDVAAMNLNYLGHFRNESG